jgi:hypothetical protein
VRCPLRSADLPLPAVHGTVGAKDDGHAGKHGEIRRRPANAQLDAAVDGVVRAQLVDDACVEGCLGSAIGIRARKPKDFAVWIPAIGDRRAQRRRQQVLRKMWKTVSGPNRADAVIHVGVPARSDIGSGQQRHRVVDVAGHKGVARIRGRQADCRKD